MAWGKTPWAPPLVELAGGMAGHLLAWERHERNGSWWAWVSWVHEAGGRRDHKVVLVKTSRRKKPDPISDCGTPDLPSVQFIAHPQHDDRLRPQQAHPASQWLGRLPPGQA